MLNGRTLGGLLLLLAVSIPVIASGETTLRVGVPYDGPNALPNSSSPDLINYASISTAQIDPVLAAVDPQRFGTNFTKNLANGLFNDLNGFKSDLHDSLETILLASPKVKAVKSLAVGLNPIQLTITQQNTSIGAALSNITVAGSITPKKNIPIVCTNPTATFDIDIHRIASSYDVYTGAIQGTNVFYDVDNVDVDCDNFLGDIVLAVVAMFTSVEGDVLEGIEEVFEGLTGSANVQTLFSVKDFLDGLREFSDNATVNAVADKAIDALQDLIVETNLSSGLQFMIEIDDNLDNEIRLAAMHQPIGVSDVLGYSDRTIVGLGLPASTDHVDLYTCPSDEFSISCVKLATVYSTAVVVRAVDPGSRIFAVGFNDTINGLPSMPSGSYPVVINDCGGEFCL